MMPVFWIVVLIVSIIAEAATFALVSIWFAFGALGGLIASLCGASEVVQFIVFLVVSGLTLVLTRPAVKKLLPNKAVPTNADLDIGRTAVVIEDVDGISGKGRVKLDGVDWFAVTADGSEIPKGEEVVVTAREATTLTVKKK